MKIVRHAYVLFTFADRRKVMVVLIVTGSMRSKPLNCSIRGLEMLKLVSERGKYEDLRNKLELEADPFPGQCVYVSKPAAEVLSIITESDFCFHIQSQSQDSKGKFITWSLAGKPSMIRRDYSSYKLVNHIENNNELAAKEVKVRFHCLLQLCSALRAVWFPLIIFNPRI